MKITFAVFFLFLVSCHTTPINVSLNAQLPRQHLSAAKVSVRSAIPDPKPNPTNEPNSPSLPPAASIDKVHYLSSPLRGTETRDLQALAVPHPEQQHQNYNSPNLHHINQPTNLNHVPFHNQKLKQTQTPIIVPPHSQNKPAKTGVPHAPPPRTDTYHVSDHSTNYVAQPPTTTSSNKVNLPDNHVEKKREHLTFLPNDLINKTLTYARAVYHQFKSALKAIKPKRNTPNSPTYHPKVTNHYTEEDVSNLVNDIMREIQIRTDDMRDHAEMLGKTDRWDPNHVTTRQDRTGVSDRPLLYIRTKVPVTPQTVVDAVMASTKEMFSSGNLQLPRTEKTKLLKKVQARLVEVLMPAN